MRLEEKAASLGREPTSQSNATLRGAAVSTCHRYSDRTHVQMTGLVDTAQGASLASKDARPLSAHASCSAVGEQRLINGPRPAGCAASGFGVVNEKHAPVISRS